MTADVLPIGTPGRAELWRRLQLARAVLNHRQPSQLATTLALCALDGVPIETLLNRIPAIGMVTPVVVDWSRLANDVRSACLARGVSQSALARSINVDRRTIQHLLQGHPMGADKLAALVVWLYPEDPTPRWIALPGSEVEAV